MSDQDPFHQETTRTTVVQPDPLLAPGAGPVRTQETIVTDRQPNQTAWWIAGVVAVLAIIAVLWMVLATTGQEPTVDPDEVQDAIADARLQGQLEGAQDSVAAAAAAADRAADSAARSAADAVRDPPVVVVSPPAPEPSPPPAEDVEVVVETPPAQ